MNIQKHLEKYFPISEVADTQEIILDQVSVPEIKQGEKELLEKYSNTILLSMNNCGMKNLNNLPKLNLSILELNDNKLKGEELAKLSIYRDLTKLRLSNNPINSFSDVQALASLDKLEYLDLLDCPVSRLDKYREEMFKILPKLNVLDSIYKDGAVYESDFGDEGEELEEEEDDDFIEDEEFEEEDEEELEEEDAKPVKKRRTD